MNETSIQTNISHLKSLKSSYDRICGPDWDLRSNLIVDTLVARISTREELRSCRSEWAFWAHEAQIPPDDDWRVWLFMGGRGAGKTRAGAEWVREQVFRHGKKRIALVGPTLNDVREVMIEGPSGLRNVGPWIDRPKYSVSRRRLTWPNGAEAFAFSSEDPDSLRGPQFDAAWCDEIGAWSHDIATWDMLMFGLRLGDDPRVAATTTPKPTPLIRQLVNAHSSVVTRASTFQNARYLAPGFIDAVTEQYGGTQLGRQELGGELIDDPQGALWIRSQIEEGRIQVELSRLSRTVVAIDPPASKGAMADTCGIIVAGILEDGRGVVLADGSVQGLRPMDWGARASGLANEWGAAEIIAEANQGGEMVREVIQLAGAKVAIRLVHARFGKAARAGPVAALYAQGRIVHAGTFPELEDQMCTFGSQSASGSPDRVDAMVWAFSELLLGKSVIAPRISRL